MLGGDTPTRTRKNRGGAQQLLPASLRAGTTWTNGLRWQQERLGSGSGKRGEILCEEKEKALDRLEQGQPVL